ncbi:MAG: hypothetical protein QMC82_03425 [Methanolinea sp.]|jgi:hypothetical protein|nr:hypothetical protein [Methanolinea sp.]
MSKKGIGKIFLISGKARTRYISIPADVAGDDRFPFEDGEDVLITIDENRKCLRVEKK